MANICSGVFVKLHRFSSPWSIRVKFDILRQNYTWYTWVRRSCLTICWLLIVSKNADVAMTVSELISARSLRNSAKQSATIHRQCGINAVNLNTYRQLWSLNHRQFFHGYWWRCCVQWTAAVAAAWRARTQDQLRRRCPARERWLHSDWLAPRNVVADIGQMSSVVGVILCRRC